MSKFLSMFSLLHYVFSLFCTTKSKSNMFTNKEEFYLKQYAEYLIAKLFYYHCYYYYYYYHLNVFLLFISLQLSSLAFFITRCRKKNNKLKWKIFKLFLTIIEPVGDAILIVIIFIVVDVVVVIIRPAVIFPLICAAIWRSSPGIRR